MSAGIAAAARWVARTLPVFSLNLVLVTPDGLWALRYPDTHELYVLRRDAGGQEGGGRALEHSSARRRIRVHSDELAQRPSIVVASERMDADAGWRLLGPGELLHVDGDLRHSSRVVIDEPPAHALSLADLGGRAQSSQQPMAAPPARR